MIKNEVERLNFRLELLEEVREKIFNPEIPQNEKIKTKKEIFLLKLPLFSLIYQKKGEANFKVIVDNIRLIK